ncbi:hypothetical protein GCM10027074_65320 [Streptomyces deserti]
MNAVICIDRRTPANSSAGRRINPDGRVVTPTSIAAMTTSSPAGSGIRPFRLAIPQSDLDDRLGRTRWPDELPGRGWAHGVPLEYLRDLVRYWRHDHDWRAAEARLNEWPRFTTTVDGANVHFAHVRSPGPDATPLIITHGWPGSIVEFLDVVRIVETFRGWTDSEELPEEAVDRGRLLTDVMLYWLTGTAGSSARISYERAHATGRSARPAEPPTAPAELTLFPAEPQIPLRHKAERTENLVRWTEFDRGGHFAAMEEPDLLVGDVWAFFRQLREKGGGRPLCPRRICRGQRNPHRARTRTDSGDRGDQRRTASRLSKECPCLHSPPARCRPCSRGPRRVTPLRPGSTTIWRPNCSTSGSCSSAPRSPRPPRTGSAPSC